DALTLGAGTDPGADTVSTCLVHWGDGAGTSYTAAQVAATGGVVTHAYADGPNSYAVTVDLTDEDGTYPNAGNPLSVTVDNVAPTVTLTGAESVAEGAAYSLTVGAYTDPGTDTPTAVTINWGDGAVQTVAGNPPSVTHAYADGPNNYTITATATDEDGTYSSNTLAVTVKNVAPTPAISGAPSGSPEGTTISLTGSATDPSGPDTTAGFTFAWSVTKNGAAY